MLNIQPRYRVRWGSPSRILREAEGALSKVHHIGSVKESAEDSVPFGEVFRASSDFGERSGNYFVLLMMKGNGTVEAFVSLARKTTVPKKLLEGERPATFRFNQVKMSPVEEAQRNPLQADDPLHQALVDSMSRVCWRYPKVSGLEIR